MGALHEQVIVRGKVVKPDSGVVEFFDGAQVNGKGWFRSQGKINGFSQDEPVECTFRVAKQKVYLMKIKSLDPDSQRITKAIPLREMTFQEGNHKGIYFNPEIARMFDLAYAALEEERVTVLLLRGESGYGKSSYSEAFAQEVGLTYVDVNCASIGDPEEWFGYREAEAGSTLFVLNQFAEAVIEGNCVINFDEANRIESYIANTLLPMLDHRRKTIVHKQEVKVGPRVIFTLTINEGPKFSGTFNMDAALKNRIDMGFKVGPLKPEIERQLLMSRYSKLTKLAAKGIVELCTQLRIAVERDQMSIDVSTRTSLKLAAIMSLGGSFLEAVNFVIQQIADDSDIKPIIDIANQVEADMKRNIEPADMLNKTQRVIIIETEKPMTNSVKKIDLVGVVRSIAGIDMTEAKKIVEEAQQNQKDIKLTLMDDESLKKAKEQLTARSFKFTVSA